jgi:hypothetical protein
LQKITRPAAQALARYEWEWFGGSGVNLSPAVKRAIKSQQKAVPAAEKSPDQGVRKSRSDTRH